MNEKIKIVVEHYPVRNLPDDLRRDIGAAESVRITVETELPAPQKSLASYVGTARGAYATPDSANKAIRDLREDWQ